MNTSPSSGRDHGSTKRNGRLKSGFRKIGKTLQKINLPRLIDEMEKDQELANQLENMNQEIKEESDRKELVRQAADQCMQEMKNHLHDFLESHKYATYEDWIRDLHPDNVHTGQLLEDFSHIDPRFYVTDSDHRIMWNEMVPDRQVGAQSVKQQTELLRSRSASPSSWNRQQIDLLE